MDTLPLWQATTSPQPNHRPAHKASQSQTTIDLYLKPVVKVRQNRNDIRNYFRPVAKVKVAPIGESSESCCFVKTTAAQKVNPDDNRVPDYQTPDRNLGVKARADTSIANADSQRADRRVPGISRARNHNYSSSAVLPKFDPIFDNQDFKHSTSPMAPRVTDVVRHSLVPKPLNIKLPPPPVEAIRSPSETTSSPSSVGDPDTAPLDGETREAPSFKQTYRSFHSRNNTNDSPISPLTALRGPGSMSVRQRTDRPAALRSKTVPQLPGLNPADSVIYFLPTISPTSDSSADEWEPLIRARHSRQTDKVPSRDPLRANRHAVGLEGANLEQPSDKKGVLKEHAMIISPGLQRYYEYLASQKNGVPTEVKKANKKKVSRRNREEEKPSLGRAGSATSGNGRKKGKGLLRLMESYSRHVERLQMIQ